MDQAIKFIEDRQLFNTVTQHTSSGVNVQKIPTGLITVVDAKAAVMMAIRDKSK